MHMGRKLAAVEDHGSPRAPDTRTVGGWLAFSEREVGRLKTKLGPSAGAGTKLEERLELKADGSADSAVVSRAFSADKENGRGKREGGWGPEWKIWA